MDTSVCEKWQTWNQTSSSNTVMHFTTIITPDRSLTTTLKTFLKCLENENVNRWLFWQISYILLVQRGEVMESYYRLPCLMGHASVYTFSCTSRRGSFMWRLELIHKVLQSNFLSAPNPEINRSNHLHQSHFSGWVMLNNLEVICRN